MYDFHIEFDREDNGRWIAEVMEIPGAMAYGATQEEAQGKAVALALRAVAERIEHGEALSNPESITFAAVV
jgi:predicted RNase H-like HicB family nuclease